VVLTALCAIPLLLHRLGIGVRHTKAHNEIGEDKLMGIEHFKSHRCEHCDRETTKVVESLGPDNRPHYLCWDCVARDEKRFNQKPGWRRAHRTQRYQPVS